MAESDFVMANKPDLAKKIAVGQEKKLLQDFVTLLKPIAESTPLMSSSKCVTSSSVIPTQLKINKLLRPNDSDHPAIATMKTAMNQNYSKRDTLTNPHLLQASVLDVSTRRHIKASHTQILLQPAIDEAKKQEASKTLRSAIPAPVAQTSDPTAPPPAKKKKITLQSFLMDSDSDDSDDDSETLATHASAAALAKAEVERFVQMPYPTKDENFKVLQWWKQNHKSFPTLAPIARRVLAIQASAVSSERTWSTAGRISDKYRHSLTGHNLSALIILNRNQ